MMTKNVEVLKRHLKNSHKGKGNGNGKVNVPFHIHTC